MASKNQITGGAFQDIEGNPLADGYLTLVLSQDAQVDSQEIASGLLVQVPLDGSGNVSGTVNVWPNDVLSPAGTFYNVSAYSAAGQLVWGPNPQQVLSSPSPFNIGAWVPGQVNVNSGGGSGGGGILLETNGTTNGSQTKLNLVQGANVTVIDDGNGDITIAAAGSGTISPGTQHAIPLYSTSTPSQDIAASNVTTDSTGNNLNVPGTSQAAITVASRTYTHPTGPQSSYPIIPAADNLMLHVDGPGWNFGNPGGWSGSKLVSGDHIDSTRGISQFISGVIQKRGTGDCSGVYTYNFTDGGIAAQSDEGQNGATFQVHENNGYFHGTVSSTTGVGDQAPVLAFVSGNNWTTDGAFLLNISKGTVSGALNGSSTTTVFTPDPATQMTLVSVSTAGSPPPGAAFYSGTIPHGAGGALIGTYFLVAGFTNSANNGVFQCVQSSATVLTLANASAVTESHAATANYHLPQPGPPGTGVINSLPVTGVSLAASTAVGILAGQIVDPNVTANAPALTTVLVALCQIGGTTHQFSVGSVVTVAGMFFPEQAKILTATYNGDGTQTLTMNLRNPNPAGAIFQGGVQGQYISFDANLAFSGQRSSYYAFGSLTGSDLIYGVNVAGSLGAILPQTGNEAATTTGASAGFHLYPGAEVVCNTTFGFTPTLEQNAVAWAPGDVIENPHYPIFGGQGLFVAKTQNSVSNSAFGSGGITLWSSGTGLGGFNTSLLELRNLNPNNYYTTNGGPLIPPVGILLGGALSIGMYSAIAPQSGIFRIDGPATPGDGTTLLFNVSYKANGLMSYNNTDDYYQCNAFNAGAYYVGGTLGASGTFTTADSKTVTVTNGLITSIV